MAKDNGIWTDRLAVQKAFDADPQRAYSVINAVLALEKADTIIAAIEAGLVPQPTDEDVKLELESVREKLAKYGVDTTAIDAKIDDLGGLQAIVK